MIAFLDEDRAYLSWVAHHRTGFVLEAGRKLSKKHVVLHRAACPEIKSSALKRTHWTTGRHLKACSLDATQLSAWVREQIGTDPIACPVCHTAQDSETTSPGSDAEIHLTRLDREVLSMVLEIASIHLDDPEAPCTLDVGDVAHGLRKSPAQLSAALERLVGDGLITLSAPIKPGQGSAARSIVIPTLRALRLLPACAELNEADLMHEWEILSLDRE